MQKLHFGGFDDSPRDCGEPYDYAQGLAAVIGKSERTIKSRTIDVQEKGYLRRENGKRNDRWELSDSAKKSILNQ